jgi:hypothetical protein
MAGKNAQKKPPTGETGGGFLKMVPEDGLEPSCD